MPIYVCRMEMHIYLCQLRFRKDMCAYLCQQRIDRTCVCMCHPCVEWTFTYVSSVCRKDLCIFVSKV